MQKLKKYLRICFVFVCILFFTLAMVDTNEVRYKTNFSQDNIIHHIEKLTENGPRSVLNKDANEKAVQYIASTMDKYGLVNEDSTTKPAYLIQEFETYDERYQKFDLKNVIVHIPANSENKTNQAIMFMAHLDSVPLGEGASDDGVSCAVLMEAVRYYLNEMENGLVLNNDLVFCFVNGEEFNLYGSKAFMKEFVGFNDITERIRFGTNLESRGTSGTLIMFETGKNNYKTIQLFSSVNKNIFSCSIATLVYDTMPNSTDFTSFKEYYQGLNMANISGGENYHTQEDNLENLGMSYLSQQADIVDRLIDKLGNYQLDSLYESDESAIFFTYLNITTVIYNHTMVIILLILAVSILIANILLSIFYAKKNNLKNTCLAILTTIISFIVSGVLALGLYYLFQLTAVLFNTIDIHMIGNITYSNNYITIGMALLGLIIAAFASYYGRKFFKIEVRDLNRAQAYIQIFLGIVLSLVVKDASYLFMISGLLLLINELLITIFKDKKLEQYHFDLLITALSMPIIIPVISLAIVALGLTMSYVYLILFTLALFNLGAYLSTYVNLVSFRRLRSQNTTHFEGFLHLTVIPLIIFLVVSMFHLNPGVNLEGKQKISNLPYDDALVLVVNENNEKEYRVYDLNAYQALKKYCKDMIYHDSYYVKEDINIDIDFSINSTSQGKSLEVNKLNQNSIVYLTFKNITDATTFEIETNGNVQEFEFNNQEEYEILIHTDSIVTLKSGSAEIEYKELLIDYSPIIPSNYQSEEMLHFNLWMMKNFNLE